MRIQYSVNTWICKDFDNNINSKELGILQTKVNSIVDKYILMDASNIIYRDSSFKTYTDDFAKDKYIVIRSFWLAYALFAENPLLSFAEIKRDAATVDADMQRYLRSEASKYAVSNKDLKSLLLTLEMMQQIELFNIRDQGLTLGSYDKIFAYEKALKDLYEYIGVYRLGYSKDYVQDKKNLESLINVIKRYYTGQFESARGSPYSQKVHIDKNSLDTLSKIPKLRGLVDHLKRVNILNGFPKDVLAIYSDTTRISTFNRRLIGFATKVKQRIKAAFVNKIIDDGIVTEYKYGSSLVPDFLKDLFKNSQGTGTGSGGTISHEVIIDKMQKSQYYVGSEVNVWINLEADIYTGHIDLLLFDPKTNTIYVCDYKPDMSISDKGYHNFLNSVPQVAGYGLNLQKQGDVKVQCVIFNSQGAWIFNPNKVLDPINEFMAENNEGWYPPWVAFSKYL